MGRARARHTKRLERGRDGHRRRRERRRQAERAVRVLVLVPRRHGVAVHLAVEPVLSEDGVDTAAGPRLVWRGDGHSHHPHGRLLAGLLAVIFHALTTHNGPGRPRRRHLPLPEGPQVRVLPARVDSQFLRRASARKLSYPHVPLVVYISRSRYVRLRKKVDPSSCYHISPYRIAIYHVSRDLLGRPWIQRASSGSVVDLSPAALQKTNSCAQCEPPWTSIDG